MLETLRAVHKSADMHETADMHAAWPVPCLNEKKKNQLLYENTEYI